MRVIGLFWAGLFLLGFRGTPCYAPDLAKSQVWIEGRSTVKRFTCAATQLEGSGAIESGQTLQGWLEVPVRSFECGNQAMNRDLQKALQADRFPKIRFELGEVSVRETPTADSAQLEVAGVLTIAGTTRPVRFVVAGRQLEAGCARLAGSLPLNLTDFNVTPPTVLLGLIRVHDQVMIHFDLVVQPAARGSCAVVVADLLNQP